MHISSLSTLPPNQIEAILADLTDSDADELLHSWSFFARPNQLPPNSLWTNWLLLAGRGFGKTRTGAEWVRSKIKAGCRRGHLIAPTAGDARDVMVEGESGLLAVCWEGDKTEKGEKIGKPFYEPSKRRVTWENGAMVSLFSAEEPERLRGPQCEFGWCDELAAWTYLRETWDMYQFGLRLGDNPQTCITTTPKPLSLLREMVKQKSVALTRGSTFDNLANLADPFIKTVREKYEGTRLGRQELEAELLDEAEGALWTRKMVEKCQLRTKVDTDEFRRIVVAIDPAVTAKEESNETGIVVAGIDYDKKSHILEDASGRYSPAKWAKTAINLFDKWDADRFVAEGNQGGDLVADTIQTRRPTAPVKIVHAHRGKAARAEPVAALYEQGKVFHRAPLPELEDQMVIWEPLSGDPSPDRLDALVWAVTELALDGSTYSLDALAA